MQFFYDRKEVEKQLATELRVITLPCGLERPVRLEKYIWDEYNFITGRVYGYAYSTDSEMVEWAERSAAEIDKPFDYALDQLIRFATFKLTGKLLSQA